MNLSELCSKLDAYFNIAAYAETDWHDLIPEAARGALQRFLQDGFTTTWNGLMLNNVPPDDDIDRVYLAVFPSQDVLDTIIAREVERGAPGTLIFTHHPLSYSESKAVFKPIPTAQLEELQSHHISLYSCHAPLDCHPETSTTSALAAALELEEGTQFGQYYAGKAGIHGKVTPTTFQDFAKRLAEVCELPYLRYDQCHHNGQSVHHVAIVAGGGGDIDFINEASAFGADTYITGHWWLFGDSEFGQQHREKMQAFVPTLKLNLLGASHYSSEMVVMRDQMVDWFREQNLEAMLMRQEDPWQ
ncbi:MAG: hypothetical protein GYB66_04210 [Chloroflexi bacterium]|nr:hypothetical protein [Chloroflexota bacterium]